MRRPLVNDVSRKQVERAVDVAEAFGVDHAILPFSGGGLGLMEKPVEVLARRFAISRLVSATDDDIHSGPTPFSKIILPAREKRVQLFELDAHRQLRSVECG